VVLAVHGCSRRGVVAADGIGQSSFLASATAGGARAALCATG
jgi:hypothetical protein